jgi:ABC-2 type transport system ATP-binding protein
MVLQGTVSDLARKVLGGAYRIQLEAEGSAAKLRKALEALPGVHTVAAQNGKMILEAQKDVRAEAAEAVIKAGGRLKGLSVEAPSLDDIYTRYFEEVKNETVH